MKQLILNYAVRYLALCHVLVLTLFGIGVFTPANADILVDTVNLAKALPSAAGRDLTDRGIADQYQQQYFIARLKLSALARRADQHFENVNQAQGTALPKIHFQALGRIRLQEEVEDYRQKLERRDAIIDGIIGQHGLSIPLKMPVLPSAAGRDMRDPNVFAEYVEELTVFDLMLLAREELSARALEAAALRPPQPDVSPAAKRTADCHNTPRLVWEPESRPEMVRNFNGTMSMQTRSTQVQRWRNFDTCK